MRLDPLWWLVAVAALAMVAWVAFGWHRRALRTRTWWAVAGLAALAGVTALQPALGASQPSEAPSGLDVVLVIDRTTSMGAEDYAGSKPRIDGVAADVQRLVGELGPARYAVITSDNVAQLAVPWTTDASAVVSLAQTVGWREESYGNGSDIADAAPEAERLLQGSAAQRPDARRFFVYFGDGEQTSPEPPGSFAALRPYLSGGLVLGYGTTEGGKMRQSPYVDTLVTRDGEPQLSHLDESTLRELAQQVGGSYLHRDAPGAIPAQLPAPAPALLNDAADAPLTLGWLPAIGALAIVCVGWFDRVAAAKQARRATR